MNIKVILDGDETNIIPLDTITHTMENDEVDNAFCLSIGESMELSSGSTIKRVA